MIDSKHTPTPVADTDLELRHPELRDGASLWRLARASGSLDENSPYLYHLWRDQFAATSVIAEVAGEPAGFVCAFRSRERQDVLFVWQVAVDDACRGRGLATRMLTRLLRRNPGVRFVEATVTPSNGASRRLFTALAGHLGCPLELQPYLAAEEFPVQDHEAEELFRIGPITTRS